MGIEGFEWQHYLIDCLNVYPTQLVYFYVLTRVMKPRNAVAYWVVMLAVMSAWLPFKPLLPQAVTGAYSVFLQVVLPCLLFEGKMLSKVLILICGFVLVTAMDLPAALIWVFVVGNAWMSYEAVLANLPAYLLMVVVHLALLIFALWVFVVVCRKTRIAPVSESSKKESGAMVSYLRAFFPFMLMQTVMVCLLVECSVLTQMGADSLVLFTACFTVGVVADVLAFMFIRRCTQAELAEMEAAALEERANGYLAAAEAVQGQLRDVAVLCHDLRNHMQVVEGLCERGDWSGARAYLKSLTSDRP